MINRRQFLANNALGLGTVALSTLLDRDGVLAKEHVVPRTKPTFDMQPKSPPAHPRANAMISLFMHGGPSHMDLFDPKPELTRQHGKVYDDDVAFSFINRATKTLMASPWRFRPHGDSGTEVSELLPNIARIVDDICVVRSMHTGFNGHEVSIRYMNAGIPARLGRPSLGAWLTYALGCVTDDLPAYMVLVDPGGHPVDSTHNWSNGFMPPLFQGTVVRANEPRIFNLNPPAHLSANFQRQNLDLLRELNQQHLERHAGEADLEARIASYELAASMQIVAQEALNVDRETAATHAMYGLDNPETKEYGTRCLIARRLVERGVRFVQLFLNGQPWDNHSDIKKNLAAVCRRTDQPAAALVQDLKQRGLLESTLVHWGGEIGRLPVTENHGDPTKAGRDHNGQGFSTWLAGGGIRGGMTFGETDEVGHRAVTDVVTANDYQATLLHLFGLDHSQLHYQHNGQKRTLTNHRPCRIVKEILA